MNILKAIEMRKSVRSYTEERIEEEKLKAMIRAGNLAPVFGRFHITVIEIRICSGKSMILLWI